MRASRINPRISAYKAIWGPYDWNHFPLAPPGCKAVIYKSPATRGSWGSLGMDAWYLGPSLDHYRCNHYFVPETRAYRISGSAELFAQHCQVPFLSTNDHMQELTNEVVALSAEQRVDTTPEITTLQDLRRMSNAPPIMNAPNPTTKQALKSTKRVHRRITRNNVPGTVPNTSATPSPNR